MSDNENQRTYPSEPSTDFTGINKTFYDLLYLLNELYDSKDVIASYLAGKVDKVNGKGLSENDFTTTLLNKLNGIASNAEVNVQANWSESDSSSDAYIQNKPSLGTVASCNTGTTEGTIPILGVNGKLNDSVIPAIAITDTFVVNSEASMLALTCEVGDVCVRTDLNKSFILQTAGASTLSHWQELLTPTDAVSSVNGKTGTVVLATDDISDTNQSNKFIPSATLTSLNELLYSATKSYTENDIVIYSGRLYVCKAASTGNAPSSSADTTYWTRVFVS